MKVVKSLADATRMAAQSGAVMEVGGRTVNAGGARMELVKTPTSEPQAVAPQAPVDPLEGVKGVMAMQASIVAAQGQQMTHMMAEVMDRMQQQAPTARPFVRPSKFMIERDEDGVMTAIIPVYPDITS